MRAITRPAAIVISHHSTRKLRSDGPQHSGKFSNRHTEAKKRWLEVRGGQTAVDVGKAKVSRVVGKDVNARLLQQRSGIGMPNLGGP